MGRFFAAFLVLLLPAVVRCQTVVIEGLALDSAGKGNVSVMVMDSTTSGLFGEIDPGYRERQKKLNPRYLGADWHTRSGPDGHFRIRAGVRDSISFSANRHQSRTFLAGDLLKQETIVIRLNAKPCIPYVAEPKRSWSELVAFVGVRSSLRRTPRPDYCGGSGLSLMDQQFSATYHVVQKVYGDPRTDLLSFRVFDHYGIPGFADHDTVLLFVSRYDDIWVHEKYQYFALLRTRDGRLAAAYDPSYFGQIHKNTTVKPEPVDFIEPPSFDLKGRTPEQAAKDFPAPYYRIEGGRAIVAYGNYVEELVELKKQTVLKARGYHLK